METYVIKSEIADHFSVGLTVPMPVAALHTVVKYRVINEQNIARFVDDASRVPFLTAMEGCGASEACEMFCNLVTELYDGNFPVKVKRCNSRGASTPWMTRRLKRCINKGHRLYRMYVRGLINRHSYKVYKNLLSLAIKKVKRVYYSNLIKNTGGNLCGMWKTINKILKRNCKAVPKNMQNGNVILNGHEMVNNFNSYSVNIAMQLAAETQVINNEEYFNHFQSVNNSCFLLPTTVDEVSTVIKNLPNKATGINDVDVRVYKACHHIIAPNIAYLYNLSVESGEFPTLLKVGRVTPVFKSGQKTSVTNYRPISSLSNLSKIFEKLTFARLSDFVVKNNLISGYQFGFRKNTGITFAIFRLMNCLLKVFHQKTFAVCLFLDLQKAFDCVDHEVLLRKLCHFGFRGVCQQYLRSYLTSRKQFVQVDAFMSNSLNILKGVPQGSTLGPLLFNLYINDIGKIKNAETILFADDGVFIVDGPTFEIVHEKLKGVINCLSDYLKWNKLLPNLEKTKLMLFTPRPHPQLPVVYFNNTVIEWVDNIKYLGLIVNNKLNFSRHIDDVCLKISKAHGSIYSLCTFVPSKITITIVYATLYPVLIQNIVIWGGSPESSVSKIRIALNKVLRTILKIPLTGGPPRISANEMYVRFSLLKYDDVYKYFLLKFYHECRFGAHVEIYRNYFLPLLPASNHNTRSSKYNLPVVRLEVEKQATIFQCIKVINAMPEELLRPQSMISLKNKYRKLTLNRYNIPDN